LIDVEVESRKKLELDTVSKNNFNKYQQFKNVQNSANVNYIIIP